MAELLDLYDENGRLTGKTVKRGLPFSNKYYVFIVHCCLINSKNEILCQRRSLNKKGNPGYWDITASGFVLSGETIYQGINRELSEELGIKANFDSTNLSFILKGDGTLHGFFFKKEDIDLENLKLQKSEVMDACYYSIDQIEAMMQEDTFIVYGFLDLIKQVISKL